MDFELQPHLEGELIKLRPLSREDFFVLYEIASDPLVWEQHPHKERYQREVFEHFFEKAIESNGALVALRKDMSQGSQRAIEKIGASLIERVPHKLPDGTPYMEMIYEVENS